MQNILAKIRSLTLKDLFIHKTDDTLIQLFRYVFVGGIAFIIDYACVYLFEKAGLHYLVAAAIAFVMGLTVNYVLSKIFIFTGKNMNRAVEFMAFAVIGVIGLGLTELLMYLMTDIAGLYFMISKAIATVIVLGWNFAARKIFLYRKR